jgi:hypothetical protein
METASIAPGVTSECSRCPAACIEIALFICGLSPLALEPVKLDPEELAR